MIYRRRPSSLHAARAWVAALWLAAIGVAVLINGNPVVLGAILGALLLAGWRAQVGWELGRVAAYAVPVGVLIALVNALVSRQGFTVIWRFGDLPVLGETHVTLEATVYGAILGLRAVELILIGALYSLAVDPDEILRMLRRVSFGSALSATVANRMIPILVRDGRRLADAQRCRPGPDPGRLALMRATTTGVLDRALDVAAALEVRGYSTAQHSARRGIRESGGHAPPQGERPGGSRAGTYRPYSRHDRAFGAAAALILAASVSAAATGVAPFRAYPALVAPAGVGVIATALVIALALVTPTVSRKGVVR